MLIVMGLAGAGKSTVLKYFLEKNRFIRVINYGDVAVDIAIKRGLVKNRDEINLIPPEYHSRLQKEVVSRLKDTPKTILDTHAILRKKEGYLPGLTPDLFKKIKVEGFVFIDAPSSEIIWRRKNDKTRKRKILTKDEIDRDRMLSEMLIASYSAAIGAPFFLIQNRNGKINEAVKEFEKIIKFLGWK